MTHRRRDLIDIVTTLEGRGVGVQSLTNGIVDTTTAHGKLVFGMFALMARSVEWKMIRVQVKNDRFWAGFACW